MWNFGGSLQCSNKEDVIFQSILFSPGQGRHTQQVWTEDDLLIELKSELKSAVGWLI
jgi:hypothetical protein